MPASAISTSTACAVERAHLVGGFGKIRWLSAAELTGAAAAAGLAEGEEGIVSHMNEDHADAVQLYAGKLLGLAGERLADDRHRCRGRSTSGRAAGSRGWRSMPRLAAADEARKVLVALVAQGASQPDSAARHPVRRCEI